MPSMRKRIVKMHQLGIEKTGGQRLGDVRAPVARREQGQTGFAGECGGFVGTRLVDDPTLTR